VKRDELLKMLDLNKPAAGGDDAIVASGDDAIVPDAAAAAEPASPTALRVDAWGMRRGRELLTANENERLLKALLPDVPAVDCAPDSMINPAVPTAADCYAAAFEPEPQLAPRCESAARSEFFKQLLDTPEYKALHEQTQLDPVASELAATAFAEQVAVVVKEAEKPGAPPPGSPGAETSALRGVARALDAAGRDVGDYKDACNALGCGPGAGGAGAMDARRAATAFRRVRGSARLRRIAELAGRFRRVAAARQRQKVLHAQDEVAGVELGADLGRLLPAELAKLADPDLELDALRRLVERQTMQRELRASEPVGKGPVVVVVDESGSMDGDPVAAAKALALAVVWVARQQRRWCALVAFSGGTEGRLLVLPPGRQDEGALLDWLEAFLGGGTSLDVPLRELPERYWPAMGAPKGRTDLLLITDAVVRCPDDIRESFLAWKRRDQVRCVSIIINEPPGDLAAVSDEVYRVPSSIAAESDAAAAAVSF
jgi:uncharacterized protein with von Willebrand factor type A (vWA) domain